MDIPWNDSQKCEYEDADFEDYDPQSTPNVTHELYRDYSDLSEIDLSSVGVNNLVAHDNFHTEVCDSHLSDEDEEETFSAPVTGQPRKVNGLLLDYFRSKLVEHFNMLFEQKKLAWPKSSRTEQTL